MDFLTNIDFSILNFIREHISCGALDFIMPIISSWAFVGGVIGITTIVFLFMKKHRKTGVALVIGLIIGILLVSIILKPIIDRPRPFIVNDAINLIVSPPSGSSFPSQHTILAFIWAIIPTFVFSKKFAFVGFPIAILIAFSRPYLYVHYPSDVIAGIIFAILASILAIVITNFIWKKFMLKNKNQKEQKYKYKP